MAPKSQHIGNGMDKTHLAVNIQSLRRQHRLRLTEAVGPGYFSLFID